MSELLWIFHVAKYQDAFCFIDIIIMIGVQPLEPLFILKFEEYFNAQSIIISSGCKLQMDDSMSNCKTTKWGKISLSNTLLYYCEENRDRSLLYLMFNPKINRFNKNLNWFSMYDADECVAHCMLLHTHTDWHGMASRQAHQHLKIPIGHCVKEILEKWMQYCCINSIQNVKYENIRCKMRYPHGLKCSSRSLLFKLIQKQSWTTFCFLNDIPTTCKICINA